jgi:predicted nucleotide-binding protein (sugar kinase/HSP70/actin superfamily)
MQIDEHTADAGVITRMEAFADTAAGRNGRASHADFRTDDTPVLELGSKRLWIPSASGAADALSAALQAWGIDAAPLPRSADPGMNLARRAISEDVCLPMLVTTQDILERVSAPDFDPEKEAFFQGQSEGPCRFGMYCMMQRRILDKMGLPDVDIVALGNRSAHGGLGMDFLLVAWGGLLAHDMLDKMRLHTRPYEARAGTSDAIFRHYLRKACDLMPHQRRLLTSGAGRIRLVAGRHTRALEDLLRSAQRDFAAAPRRADAEPRPVIGMVGEFFVRIHDGSNQEIIRKLERAGAEVWLAPATEFFSYCNSISALLAADRWEDSRSWDELRNVLSARLMTRVAVRDEHHLFAATLPYLDGFDDIGPDELIEEGSRYVHPTFGGEAICSMGKAGDFARRQLDGIVSVAPFNCMPGMTVTMLSQAFRRHHDNIPFLNLDYDGFVDASRDAKIVSFMSQVKERKAARRRGPQKPDAVSSAV